ncbi:hypothetical protein BGY98DRAFT_936392 [Russula aff. rugulosa BPL654]|nr:hypothetical protein BGY98DRAFT_936392 [Russula aff. rugulosa BPL654]
MAFTPPPTSSGPNRAAVKGGAKPNWLSARNVDLSVFDILNIFRHHWFLLRANLLANAISAQKDENGNISWVEFSPHYHSYLVKCAVALVPHPVLKVKKVMFGYVLELLNGKGISAFFNLQTGGCKANNAQKEKRHLSRKRSRASKREQDRKAAKVTKLLAHERQCMAYINLLILLPSIPDNYKCLSIPIDYLSDSSIPPNPTLAKECHKRRKQLIHHTVALGFRGRAHRGVVRFNCYGEIFKQAVCVEGGISVWWAGRVHRRRRAEERQATSGKHRLCVIEGTVEARGARSFLGGQSALSASGHWSGECLTILVSVNTGQVVTIDKACTGIEVHERGW